MGKRSPDEFAVVSRAPLIVPPDFELRPPRPGESAPAGRHRRRPGARDAARRRSRAGRRPWRQDARGRRDDHPVASAGQQALLPRRAAAPSIPRSGGRSPRRTSRSPRSSRSCSPGCCSGASRATLGATVDAPAEAQRLRANRAEGQPATAGDTPTCRAAPPEPARRAGREGVLMAMLRSPGRAAPASRWS